jgi:hypothetical protein
MVIYVIFSAVPLSRYMQKKEKVTLYYAMTNIIFTSLFVVLDIGIMDALEDNSKTDTYYFSILYMNIGIIAVSIFYFLFLAEISNINNKRRIIVMVAGIAVILFQLLIWPQWFPDVAPQGMQLTYVTQIFQTIFCVLIYESDAHLFCS